MNSDDGSHGRFLCRVAGCDRSFMRKEHLTRHQRTHNAHMLHVCQVCFRKFNRSDSLLRHLGRHGDIFKPKIPARSKRACNYCHTSKIKCDGNVQCSACLKKGVECKYGPEDASRIPETPAASSRKSEVPDQGLLASSNAGFLSSVSPSNGENLETEIPALSRDSNGTSHGIPTPGPQTISLQGPSNQHSSPVVGFIDWSVVKIRNDLTASNNEDMSDGTEKYLETHFTHFHPRWPILHRPSYDEGNDSDGLISSTKMIGAWLEGDHESRQFSINAYHRLIDQILPRLSRISSQDKFQQSLSAALCQAALINITFGLYCGDEKVLSRCIVLRDMLVAVLREVGFFSPSIVWPDEKPSCFLPFQLMKMGQRQRLAIALYKIDTYLSILRLQPPLLQPEELHFPVPPAFALWNADGLHMWERRQATEPLFRSSQSIFQMISSSTSSDPAQPEPERPMLIEDLQLSILATYPQIWQLSTSPRIPQETSPQLDTLRARLSSLKLRLDQMRTQPTNPDTFGQEAYLPLRYYYGFEDHSEPGWQSIVLARAKALLFDTLMQYHLFSLHLYADIRSLTQVAKDSIYTPEQLAELNEARKEAGRRRRCLTAGSCGGANMRRAVCEAVDVLAAHENLARRNSDGVVKETIDPVAYITLSVGALVIWGYCTFGMHACGVCCPSFGSGVVVGLPIVELMDSPAQRGHGNGNEGKKAWIEMGGDYGVHVGGMQLCQCTVKFLTARFKKCLPDGWDVADSIAPGVFKKVV